MFQYYIILYNTKFSNQYWARPIFFKRNYDVLLGANRTLNFEWLYTERFLKVVLIILNISGTEMIKGPVDMPLKAREGMTTPPKHAISSDLMSHATNAQGLNTSKRIYDHVQT